MTLEHFINNFLPAGSGFNHSWEFVKKQKNGALIFETYYHNMNDNGYYDGYTKVRLKITRKKNDATISLVGKKKYIDYCMRKYFYDTIYRRLKKLDAFTITDIN